MSTEFTLSKIFYYLFLSPLPFVILFLLASVFAAKLRLFFLSAAASLYFLSSGFGVKVFVEPLENSFWVGITAAGGMAALALSIWLLS